MPDKYKIVTALSKSWLLFIQYRDNFSEVMSETFHSLGSVNRSPNIDSEGLLFHPHQP